MLLEFCLLDVLKFCCLYFLANIGFCLAFYTLKHGSTYVVSGQQEGLGYDGLGTEQPFKNIGYGMIQLLR